MARKEFKMKSSSTIRKLLIAAAITILGSVNLQRNTSIETGTPTIHQYGPRSNPSTTPRRLPTLTLLDPYFKWGFRNQHMRFVALVSHAIRSNLTQVLLPSLSWGDLAYRTSLGHEYLFDVNYWNERAEEKGLPRLVHYDKEILEPDADEACFNITSRLWRGFDEGFYRQKQTNMDEIDINAAVRRTDLPYCRGDSSPEDGNAKTYLVPFGEGKGPGRLWEGYKEMQKENQGNTLLRGERTEVEQSIFQLMRPSIALRRAMDSAIQSALTRNDTGRQNSFKWMALHPRVEHGMLGHRCNLLMEKNLTKVFERIGNYPAFSTIDNVAKTKEFNYNLLFIAINAANVERPPSTNPRIAHLRSTMIENNRTFVNARHHGVSGVPLFLSGSKTAKEVRFQMTTSGEELTAESLRVSDIVSSVIDFFISVKAPLFIGVRGSSFSTDIFAVRHYLNKDKGVLHGENYRANYIIGPEGIEELIGPPQLLGCPPESENTRVRENLQRAGQ